MKYFKYLLILLLLLFNCKKGPNEYITKVKINRMEIVRVDDDKIPILMDVEVNYPDCPGDQIEILRADKSFAKCFLQKYKANDTMDARLIWKWNGLGFYKWDVVKIGECYRKIDLEDEGSYDMIEECEDYIEHGAVVGFRCKRVATDELIAKCPWFRRK